MDCEFIESDEPVSPKMTQLTPTFSQNVIFVVDATTHMSPAEPNVFTGEANPSALGASTLPVRLHHQYCLLLISSHYHHVEKLPNAEDDVSCQYVPDVIAPADLRCSSF